MPIYEYQCKDCGHEMEVLQKLSDAPLKDCPACQKPELGKKISAAGFRLKGGGWYETDFKGNSDKKKNLAGDSHSSSSETSAPSTSGSANDSGGAKTASTGSGSTSATT